MSDNKTPKTLTVDALRKIKGAKGTLGSPNQFEASAKDSRGNEAQAKSDNA